ncbi:MAG: thiamine pyrophosphate-dependent dehydrogenase E1 component subunit alpha [Dehalococcoidia bacterium]
MGLQERAAETQHIFDLYGTMVTIRAFEEAAIKARAAGDIRGSVHPYVGQEAIATAVCAHLRPQDLITSNHRGHGHSIAKGADPGGMMKELFGRVGGTSGGKGGSMHIADFSVGMMGANGILADGIPIAVGAAQASVLLEEDRIVVCFHGDGATNRGPFFEGLNWAMVYHLPVLFVCEDNMYASSTRTSVVSAGPGPAARAESFGMPARTVDGNDIVAVDEVAAELIAEVRNGGGPRFLHAKTYRVLGHISTDTLLYREPGETERYLERDPIPRCERWLREQGVSAEEIKAVQRDAAGTIAVAVEAAAKAPAPDASVAFQDVQDVGGPA